MWGFFCCCLWVVLFGGLDFGFLLSLIAQFGFYGWVFGCFFFVWLGFLWCWGFMVLGFFWSWILVGWFGLFCFILHKHLEVVLALVSIYGKVTLASWALMLSVKLLSM